MALGRNDAAFATLVRLYAGAARGPITGITLIAGFASTVGWPVTAVIAEHYGWRASCFAWAALHVAIALPVNLAFIPRVRDKRVVEAQAPQPEAAQEASAAARGRRNYRRAFFLLALFGAMTSFVTSAMAAHLPGLLLSVGTSTVAALTAAALLGQAQSRAARLMKFLTRAKLLCFLYHLLTARIGVKI